MALSDSDKRRINGALAREPEWKQRIILASVDAFCDWLRRVLPGVVNAIWNYVEDAIDAMRGHFGF